jgi:hypothetical protein
MACNLRKSDTIKLHKCHLISWATVIRYMFKNYVIQIVSDFRQVDGFFRHGTPVSVTNETDHHDITEIL